MKVQVHESELRSLEVLVGERCDKLEFTKSDGCKKDSVPSEEEVLLHHTLLQLVV